LGGGNFEHLKEQNIIATIGEKSYTITDPVIFQFTFRSKKAGWKKYRMELTITEAKG
jgi:hypothetical protein